MTKEEEKAAREETERTRLEPSFPYSAIGFDARFFGYVSTIDTDEKETPE